jgi:hypothetical protein
LTETPLLQWSSAAHGTSLVPTTYLHSNRCRPSSSCDDV